MLVCIKCFIIYGSLNYLNKLLLVYIHWLCEYFPYVNIFLVWLIYIVFKCDVVWTWMFKLMFPCVIYIRLNEYCFIHIRLGEHSRSTRYIIIILIIMLKDCCISQMFMTIVKFLMDSPFIELCLKLSFLSIIYCVKICYWYINMDCYCDLN